ncbi:hypothetical protein HY29_01525 [Hyphomonas beringensis]|uniref:HAD family hydrolase n=1 Tax=Hyphomonas beringensis TaxID=1280946 RepID=A0A062U3J1_9PROT|nr:HAD-IA family hydrolase [Hyphomonas beringensis]KCZ54911.1 hypothetical protein HY29_01525 [Hyphomonas beringensis]
MAHGLAPSGAHDVAAIARTTRGYLMDWDGCCAIENTVSPAAARFLKANQDCVAIVSNNSTQTPQDFLNILSAAGIDIQAEQIILAGMEAIDAARKYTDSQVMVMGDPHMRGIARNAGLQLTQEEADVIVLLRDTRFTYRRLERAVNSLRQGARLIVANPDLTHPGKNGRIKPETGALLAALKACIDPASTDIEIIGKPGPHLFLKGCKALGLSPAQVVMLGDNPATDLAGAKALGMKAILTSTDTPEIFETLLGLR